MKQFFTRCLLVFLLFLSALAHSENTSQTALNYFYDKKDSGAATAHEGDFLKLFHRFRDFLSKARKGDVSQLEKMKSTLRFMQKHSEWLTGDAQKHARILLTYAQGKIAKPSPRQSKPSAAAAGVQQKKRLVKTTSLKSAVAFLRNKQFESDSAAKMLTAFNTYQQIRREELQYAEKLRLITAQLTIMREQRTEHNATRTQGRADLTDIQRALNIIIQSIERYTLELQKKSSSHATSAPHVAHSSKPKQARSSTSKRPQAPAASRTKSATPRPSSHSETDTTAADAEELKMTLDFLRRQTSRAAQQALGAYALFINPKYASTKNTELENLRKILISLNKMAVTPDVYKIKQAIEMLKNIIMTSMGKTQKPKSASAEPAPAPASPTRTHSPLAQEGKSHSPTRIPSPPAQPERKHSAAPAAKREKTPRKGMIIVPITGRASIVPPLKTSPTTGSPKSVRIATGAVRTTDADGTQHNTARDVHVYALTDLLAPRPKLSHTSHHRTASPTKSALKLAAQHAPRAPSVKPTTQGAAFGEGRPSVREVRHVRVPDQSGVDCAFHAAKNALAIAELLASNVGVFDPRNVRMPSAQAIRTMKDQFKRIYKPRNNALDGKEVAQLLMSIFDSYQDTDVTSFLQETTHYVCAEIDLQTQVKLSNVIKKNPNPQTALVAAHDTPLTNVAQAAQRNNNLILVWQMHQGEKALRSIGHWLTILVTRAGIFVFDSLNRNNLPTNFTEFLSNLNKYPVAAAQAVAVAVEAQ